MAHPPNPYVPPGVTPKKGGGKFSGKINSTVMGTAMFVAEMQRKVPVRAKIVIAVALVATASGGYWSWSRVTARTERGVALSTALEQPPEAGAARVRELLTAGVGDEPRARGFRYLGRARDAQAVPLLVAGLSDEGDTRRAAAEALSFVGSPAAASARDPLAAALATADQADTPVLAWALVALGDPRGVQPTLEGIASGVTQQLPSYDGRLLAELLGNERLITLTQSPQATLRTYAAQSLGRRCQSEAVAPLAALTADAEQSVALSAFVSLGGCTDATAQEALDRTVAARPALRANLLAAFRTDVGAPGLLALLRSAESAPEKLDLATKLTDLHDPRAADGLVVLLDATPEREGPLRLELARALAGLGDGRCAAYLAPIAHDAEAGVALAAAEALGACRCEEAHPVLLELLRGRSALRGEAAHALGDAGACGDDVQRALAPLMSSEPSALVALARCGSEAARALAVRRAPRAPNARGPIGQEEGNTRFAAFRAVAALRAPEASSVLAAIVAEPGEDPRMRTAAADALGAAGDDATLDQSVDRALDATTSIPVRAALMRALRHRTPSSAIGRLMGYVRAGGEDARSLGAAFAVGENADATQAVELRGLLDDARARQLAAVAVLLGGDAEGVAKLRGLMRSERALDEWLRATVRADRPPVDVVALESGRMYRRIAQLLRMRDLGVGEFWEAYGRALREGSAAPGGASATLLRARFTRDLQDAEVDASTHALAAEALAAMGERGVLLAVRAGGGVGAPEAGAVLE